MVQLIEAETDLPVERRFNLGGTMICHGALVKDEIDIYAEYTGTALTAILNQKVLPSPEETFAAVAEAYRQQWNCEWLPPFGFNNTYALTVRRDDAQAHDWRTISDLAGEAKDLRAGFTAEFAERPDGYPGLREAYGFQFGSVRDMDPGLMYRAIAQGEVDVICAFATDGRIPAYDLLPLEDDQGFFPPYFAAPVVRSETLADHPGLVAVFERLGGLLDNQTMQTLNYEVDEKRRSPAAVAREFLLSKNLVDNQSAPERLEPSERAST